MPHETPYPGDQLPIDFTAPPHNLPPQEEFPLIIKAKARQIKKPVERDIAQSAHYLILTAFTSLSKIIETFGGHLPKGKQAAAYLVWSRNPACIVGITNEQTVNQ